MTSERVEWVEIIEPKTKEHMYANLTTGECVWDPPDGVKVKRTSSSQWWELFDINTHRFYYYNAFTQSTVWHRPVDCDIIPLAKLQTLKQNTDPHLRRESATQTNHAAAQVPTFSDISSGTNGFSATTSGGKMSPNVTKTSPGVAKVSPSIAKVSPSIAKVSPGIAKISPSNSKGAHKSQTSPMQSHRTHQHHTRRASDWRAPTCRHTDSDSSASGVHKKQQEMQLRKISLDQDVSTVSKHGINRSGSFVSPRKEASDDSMHEKYFKSVESTPLSRRKFSQQSGSSCDSASPQSPGSPQQRQPRQLAIQAAQIRPTLVSAQRSVDRRSRESQKHTEHQERRYDPDRHSQNAPSHFTRRQAAEPEKYSTSKHSHESHGSLGSKKSAHSDGVAAVSSKMQTMEMESQRSTRSQPLRVAAWARSTEETEPSSEIELDDEPLYCNWELRGMQHLLPLQDYIMQHLDNDGASEEWESASSHSIESSSLSGHEPDDDSSGGDGGVYLPAPTRVATVPSPPRVEYMNHDVPYYNTFVSYERNNQATAQMQRSMSGTPIQTSNNAATIPPGADGEDMEKFARSHLNLNKGIFRRKASLRSMLSYTPNAISAPMLGSRHDRRHKRAAVAMFRLAQVYMGDRKARPGMTLNSVALDILKSAYDHPALRDELYVQLCRQTTENPVRDSLLRGWELMCVCLAFVPPSAAFQPALTDYINRHRDPSFADAFREVGKWPIHVQVSHYASVACRRLEKIGHGGRIHPRCPALDDIDQARIQIIRQSMFGSTLSEVMSLQKEKFPNRQLPWIQVTLSQQVLALNGRQTEGIFRVSADVDEVNALKAKIDNWELPDMSTITDAHAPASLLKQWYRSLYEPLIPDALYPAAVAASNDPPAALRLLHRLPPLNRRVLTYLIHFLQEFTTPEVVCQTKMDSANLAMIFAPNCLRCISQDPRVILENARKEMGFLRSLITNMDTSHFKDML